jgi:flagellar basal-body rod protein FlgG
MSVTNALNIVKTGLTLKETEISVAAQNLSATGNVDAFQKLTVIGKDLPYMNQAPGALTSNTGTVNQVGFQTGSGVKVAGISRLTSKYGDYKETSDPFDLAISGAGYTRVGVFKVDGKTRNITTLEGYELIPSITVPQEAIEFKVSPDGVVQVSIQGETEPRTLGRIQLATFANPSGLKAEGNSLFTETPASGSPSIENPGTNNKGSIAQFYREGSNVNAVEEIIHLVQIQQGYEALTKVVSTTEEMMRSANQRIS